MWPISQEWQHLQKRSCLKNSKSKDCLTSNVEPLSNEVDRSGKTRKFQ